MVSCFAEEPIKIWRSFLPIPGGKWYLSRHLLKMIPDHYTYVEAFGGGALLLLRKPPSPIEVYNDIDSNLVNLFRVVRDKGKFKQFYHRIVWTLCSREEFKYAIQMENEVGIDEVEKACCTFIAIQQSFGRMRGIWAFNRLARRSASAAVSWKNVKALLKHIHRRLEDVHIENDDFRNIIPRYDTPETFFYLDPPYYPLTYSKNAIKYPLSVEDYEDLFNLLLGIKGKALLSGYPHSVYKVLEDAGWQRIDIKRAIALPNLNQTGSKCTYRIESLWFNYELPGGDVK